MEFLVHWLFHDAFETSADVFLDFIGLRCGTKGGSVGQGKDGVRRVGVGVRGRCWRCLREGGGWSNFCGFTVISEFFRPQRDPYPKNSETPPRSHRCTRFRAEARAWQTQRGLFIKNLIGGLEAKLT